MTKPKAPTPPGGLKRRGKALWRSILADLSDDWELDARELTFLERACRCEDEMADLEKTIDRDGTTVDGSKGQPRVHPALVEVRQLRLATPASRLDRDDRPAGLAASLDAGAAAGAQCRSIEMG